MDYQILFYPSQSIKKYYIKFTDPFPLNFNEEENWVYKESTGVFLKTNEKANYIL
jgi:hypothetical protein